MPLSVHRVIGDKNIKDFGTPAALSELLVTFPGIPVNVLLIAPAALAKFSGAAYVELNKDLLLGTRFYARFMAKTSPTAPISAKV